MAGLVGLEAEALEVLGVEVLGLVVLGQGLLLLLPRRLHLVHHLPISQS